MKLAQHFSKTVEVRKFHNLSRFVVSPITGRYYIDSVVFNRDNYSFLKSEHFALVLTWLAGRVQVWLSSVGGN